MGARNQSGAEQKDVSVPILWKQAHHDRFNTGLQVWAQREAILRSCDESLRHQRQSQTRNKVSKIDTGPYPVRPFRQIHPQCPSQHSASAR